MIEAAVDNRHLLAHWLTGTLAHWLTGSLGHWVTGSLAQCTHWSHCTKESYSHNETQAQCSAVKSQFHTTMVYYSNNAVP